MASNALPDMDIEGKTLLQFWLQMTYEKEKRNMDEKLKETKRRYQEAEKMVRVYHSGNWFDLWYFGRVEVLSLTFVLKTFLSFGAFFRRYLGTFYWTIKRLIKSNKSPVLLENNTLAIVFLWLDDL